MIKSKKRKIEIIGLLAILCFLCLLFTIGVIATLIISLLSCVFIVLNLYAKKKISWGADHLFSDIGRNYDYLLIGEPWDYSVLKGKAITFFAPNRSILSSYELTRRLYSLLKEESGTVILSCQEKNFNSKRISVQDIPYLHETQLHKYHIANAKLKKYLPFLFAPFETFTFLLHKKRVKNGNMDTSQYPEIRDFCKERSINLGIIKTI